MSIHSGIDWIDLNYSCIYIGQENHDNLTRNVWNPDIFEFLVSDDDV